MWQIKQQRSKNYFKFQSLNNNANIGSGGGTSDGTFGGLQNLLNQANPFQQVQPNPVLGGFFFGNPPYPSISYVYPYPYPYSWYRPYYPYYYYRSYYYPYYYYRG